MLHLHQSNRIEALLARLVEVAAAAPPGPFTPELVVTQSQGMARWIALGLAERCGIAAQLEFLLPAAFVWRLFHEQMAGVPKLSGFDREALGWRLMALLPGLLDRPGFEPLAGYLSGSRPERRLFQLCRRIADLFDRYLVYRHDLVLAWERGEERDWQAQLWRALVDGSAAPHRARLIDRFLTLARAGALDRSKLPPRVCVFGLSTLPPAYLEVLARVADATEVHLFVQNPCEEYWGDILDERTIARRRREGYLESGNRLLASWGRQGRDFLDALLEYPCEQVERFESPAGESLLQRLQRDILHLEEALPAGAAADESVQLHICHSPMREVEALHDRLLALFDADPTLTARDVVVMTPDIGLYAPCIEAVFGSAPEGRQLPYAIADLSRRGTDPIVQAFLSLLDLGQSRFTVSEVLALLELPAVARRFGLDTAALETLRRWVRDANIRWGTDSAGRERLDLPATDQHTWAFGLRRLFLGYALPEREELFHGVLPCPHVEGQAAAALGRIQRFLDLLVAWERRLAQPRSAAEWSELLNSILDALFLPEGDEAQPVATLRAAFAELVEESERGGFEAPFGLDVLADDLRARLDDSAGSQHFLTGRITFCAMLPMRSLPFRVICLIGLSDAAFPRRERPVGFDRMAQAPRRGDRSRREDDRYLFLEALLCARERLYLSYVGRSLRDNSPLLPSVLVSELFDYLRDGLGEAFGQLVTEHPLQPFSPHYFSGGRLFSYAAEWLAARSQPLAARPFCPGPLPQLAEAPREVELAALIRFFQDPARAFLRERLGIRLDQLEEALDDDEPFALDRWAGVRLGDEALARVLKGETLESFGARAVARGALPEGEFGTLVLRDAVAGVEELAAAFRTLAADAGRREVDIAVGPFRLVGWLDGVGAEGLVRCRVGELGMRERIGLYIEHLALCAVTEGPVRSRYLCRGEHWVLGPVAEPRALLATLIELCHDGGRRPLPFFPKSSGAFTRPAGARATTTPTQRARGEWKGGERKTGECEGSYVRIAWRDVEEPLDAEFERVAAAVLAPLWDCVEKA